MQYPHASIDNKMYLSERDTIKLGLSNGKMVISISSEIESVQYNILFVASDVRSRGYCKFGNFREGFIGEVS